MYPWVHLHAYPTGHAYLCCMTDMEFPIGNFKNNKHLIYYKNEFDLKEKILKISNNPKRGIKISQEAIKVIKKYHTSEYRFKKFISIINKI